MTKRRLNVLSFFITLVVFIIIANISNISFNKQNDNKACIVEYKDEDYSLGKYFLGSFLNHNNREYIVIINTIINQTEIEDMLNSFNNQDVLIIISELRELSDRYRIIVAEVGSN